LQVTDLRIRANWYRSLHQRALQRAAKLAEEVKHLRGEIREWKHRFYGRKSEKIYPKESKPSARQREKRSRGQQRGSKGHGRRDHQHLPTTTENCVLPKDQQCCGTCGEPFMEIPGSATGEILEIEVCAHRRRYERQRYRRH
jgi:transposase